MGMPGLGTLINMGMILAGSLVGMLIGKGVPERFSKIIFQALGAATFLIGLSGVFTGMLQVGESGALESSYTLLLILSLAVGGIVGEFLRLDRLFDKAGEAIKNRFGGKAGERDVGAGFANCTILFCAGAMAIVGSVQDGLLGDPTMLIAKGMLDGIMSVLFATVYGLGGAPQRLVCEPLPGSGDPAGRAHQALSHRSGGNPDVPGGQRRSDAHCLQPVGCEKIQCGQLDPGRLYAAALFPFSGSAGAPLS